MLFIYVYIHNMLQASSLTVSRGTHCGANCGREERGQEVDISGTLTGNQSVEEVDQQDTILSRFS